MARILFYALSILSGIATAIATGNLTSSSDCTCGFLDPETKQIYTDSIIVYWNETHSIDKNFEVLDYRLKIQKGFNVIFRQGADPSNVGIGNNDSLPWQNDIDGDSPSLDMFLNPPTWNHNSVGAELRSLRRDILYGTFRASMRSAQPWKGGSAMSMILKYNDSQSLQMDMLNADDPSAARITQLINGEWPAQDLSTNYTLIQNGSLPKIRPRSPWTFLDLRMDWNMTSVNFWIDNNLTRQATIDDRTIPQVPSPLLLQHWSTGDTSYMGGPPSTRSVANVRWVRAFFNTSTMTMADHVAYDKRCGDTSVPVCLIDDINLRGSTDFTKAATLPWEPPVVHSYIRKIAGYIAAAFSTFGVASLINAFIRRTPWHKVKEVHWPGSRRRKARELRRSLRNSVAVVANGLGLQNLEPGPDPGPYTQARGNESDSPPSSAPDTPGMGSRVGSPVPVTPAPEYSSSDYFSRSGAATPLPGYSSPVMGPQQPPAATVATVQRMHSLRRPAMNRSAAPTPPLSRSASLNRMRQARRPSLDSTLLGPPALEPRPPSTIVETGTEEPTPLFSLHEPEEEEDLYGDASSTVRSLSVTSVDGPGEGSSSRSISSKHSSNGKSSIKNYERSSDDDIERKHYPTAAYEKDMLKKMYADEFPVSVVLPDAAPTPMLEKPMPNVMAEIPDIAPPVPAVAPAPSQQKPQQPQQRIDYLAGLVAISCVIVTFRHFSLTFWPYITTAQGPVMHFEIDKGLSYILGPYLLSPWFVGPFFVTSCRFLAQRYLKTGKLDDVGNKMLLRGFRMLVAPFIFIMLEYFFIELGLTGALEYLPSISYSTWPFVKPQANFGVFLNQLVELAYLIPNRAPEVINNYCTGIVWTLVVQLQNSYVVLMAVVIIKEIKNPYKRFTFYAVTMAAGWYGNSWSAIHWVGLMFADLDITFGWIKKIQARWWLLYPMLFFAFALVVLAPLQLLFNGIYAFPFMAWENAIHPDVTTGRPIIDTVPDVWAAYPPYYYPGIGVFALSVGMQMIVEFSTWTQKFLSLKVITWFHPHIMTIYLMHGFIFWSLGSYTATSLAKISVPYWAILIITALVCYTAIFTLCTVVTPMTDFATKGISKNVWRWATEVPVPHRQTTAPFTKALVVGRMAEEEPLNGTASA